MVKADGGSGKGLSRGEEGYQVGSMEGARWETKMYASDKHTHTTIRAGQTALGLELECLEYRELRWTEGDADGY